MRPDLLLITLSLVYVAASQPLNLYMLDSNSTCLQQNEIFDSAETLAKTLEHTTSLGTPGSMSLGEIKIIHMKAPGCNIRQSARGIFIAMALETMRNISAKSMTSFGVFLGPPINSDCEFVSDWIVQGSPVLKDIQKLYQISFNCQRQSFMRDFALVKESPRRDPNQAENAASVATSVQSLTTNRVLGILLRYQGWKRIAIFYEVSTETIKMDTAAENIAIALGTEGSSVEVLMTHNLHDRMNFSDQLHGWTLPVEGENDYASTFIC